MEKQVGQRVQTVLDSHDLLKVYQKYGAEVFRRSSVFHGLGRFLAENEIRGRLCFEIGTWNGLTAAVLSRHFDTVVTVDIAHNALKHEVLKHLGIKNVVCIDIEDNAHKARVAAKYDFDFAYLDGDHTNDTTSDFDLTKRCGRILFHECWPFQKPVWDLVQTLPIEQVQNADNGLAYWDASK